MMRLLNSVSAQYGDIQRVFQKLQDDMQHFSTRLDQTNARFDYFDARIYQLSADIYVHMEVSDAISASLTKEDSTQDIASTTRGEVQDRIRNSHYTKKDCLEDVCVYNWAMDLASLCRIFGIKDEIQHMRHIYHCLDTGLQSLVSVPSPAVSFGDYINHIVDHTRAWRSILLEEQEEQLTDGTCRADNDEETHSGNVSDGLHSQGNW